MQESTLYIKYDWQFWRKAQWAAEISQMIGLLHNYETYILQ